MTDLEDEQEHKIKPLANGQMNTQSDTSTWHQITQSIKEVKILSSGNPIVKVYLFRYLCYDDQGNCGQRQ